MKAKIKSLSSGISTTTDKMLVLNLKKGDKVEILQENLDTSLVRLECDYLFKKPFGNFEVSNDLLI